MKFRNVLKAIFAAGLLVAAAAHGAPLYFFGNAPTANSVVPGPCPDANNQNCAPSNSRGLFLDSIDTVATATFEGSPIGNLGAGTASIFGGAGTISQQPPPFPQPFVGAAIRSGAASNGRFNTTEGAAEGSWFQSDLDVTLSLQSAVGAFGFYGTDFGDFAGSLKISIFMDDMLIDDNIFTDSSSTPLVPREAGAGANQNGSLLFFGYASDVRFNRIVFGVTQGTSSRDVLGFDDLVIGNLRSSTPPGVPEPGSLALVGLALFAAGYARKSRKAA